MERKRVSEIERNGESEAATEVERRRERGSGGGAGGVKVVESIPRQPKCHRDSKCICIL